MASLYGSTQPDFLPCFLVLQGVHTSAYLWGHKNYVVVILCKMMPFYLGQKRKKVRESKSSMKLDISSIGIKRLW